MKIGPQFKMYLQKVALITIGYLGINLFIFCFNYAFLHSPYSAGPSAQFSPKSYFLTSVLIGLISGLFGGTVLVVVNSQLFRRKSFKFAMITTGLAYVFVFSLTVLAAIFMNVIANNEVGSITYSDLKLSLKFILDPTLATYFFLWGGITLLTLFLLQVNDKFGPGILLKFLAGSYHQAQKEQRIFMFMDLRSSTTIAEKIGNELYFNLLNDLFGDITDAILHHEGEIYQYVGDEIVVSWPIKKGIRNANCIRCFSEVQKILMNLSPKYQKKYNLVPEFKAGVHFGTVMAGEVGIVKKDIIYSGDVLNTTARIQEQCNAYKVDFLISKETFDIISNTEGYELVPLGKIELRGKERKIDLNTLKTT